jgi:hypothetical protein
LGQKHPYSKRMLPKKRPLWPPRRPAAFHGVEARRKERSLVGPRSFKLCLQHHPKRPFKNLSTSVTKAPSFRVPLRRPRQTPLTTTPLTPLNQHHHTLYAEALTSYRLSLRKRLTASTDFDSLPVDHVMCDQLHPTVESMTLSSRLMYDGLAVRVYSKPSCLSTQTSSP